MAVSKTDIANGALQHIGAPAIKDIDDIQSKSAKEIKKVFDETVAEVGAMHKWNCLKRRAYGAQLSDKPIFGWEYQYRLPSDNLLVVSVNDKDNESGEPNWEVEGDLLLTNDEEAKIRYIAHILDTSLYSPQFVSCLEYYLASKVATPIRQDRTKATEMRQEFFERVLPAARTRDGGEQRKRTYNVYEGSEWISSRKRSTAG